MTTTTRWNLCLQTAKRKVDVDAFDLLKHDEFEATRALIQKTFLHDYGIIVKDFEDGSVEVVSVNKKYGSVTRMECTYLSSRSSVLSTSIKPTVGDLVLIIALPHITGKTFTTEEPIEVGKTSGYSTYNAVAIPLGVFNEDAATKIRFTDTDIDIESAADVKVSVKSLDVTTEEVIKLNGDSKSFVTHAELQSVLTSMNTAIKGHTHLVSTTGTAAAQTGSAAASVDLVTMSADISAAETTTIKTGG